MKTKLLIIIVLFQHGVTAGNSENRISIFADEMDDIILPLPRRLLHQIDQIDHIDRVIWKKGEELIPSQDGNGFGYFEGFRYRGRFRRPFYSSLMLEASDWKDGEEYSAHIMLDDDSQSSVYYRVNVYSVTAGNSENRISIFADEMDDVILQPPEHLRYQIDHVMWKKGEELISSHYEYAFAYFEDLRYRGRFGRYFYGSLILAARSWKNGEEYSAHIMLHDRSQSSVYYRVSVYSAGNSDTRISVSARATDEAILKLPELLLKHIDRVIWIKGQQVIASSYGNGSLRMEDPRYREILNISHDGSLILKAWSWKDGEEYSARIRLNNNSRSLIYYRVSVTSPEIVYAAVGEEIILPWESDIDKSEIIQIDWLTDKWDYFAATKVGGDLRIIDRDYVGYLASNANGFLIFKRVTKDYNGKYRACIFSNSGQIVENKYQVRIDERVAHNSRLEAYLDNDIVFASICIFIILLNIIFIKTVRSMGKEKELLSLQEKENELSSLQGKLKELLSLQEEKKIILHRIP